jgi:hypothetical protein
VTPLQVEKRLLELSKEIDEAQVFLDNAEQEYFTTKTDLELALATARLSLAKSGVKYTVQEKEDVALTRCAAEFAAANHAEAVVRAARSNIVRIRTQIDIARSIGTSVRASIDTL